MINLLKKKIVIIALSCIAFLSILVTAIAITASNKKSVDDVTITFVTNGGENIAPLTLKTGTEITLPEAKKEGRNFKDWYYDENFNNICAKTITANKDETLYARYGATLLFDSKGGNEIEPKDYYEGDAIGKLPLTYKDGYSFNGWYYDNEYTKRVNKNDVIEYETIIYADFKTSANTLRKVTSVKNISQSPSIKITADSLILHNENINDYVTFASSNGEEIKITCIPLNDNMFVLKPINKLEDGMTYSIKSLSSLLKFINVDENDTENADEVSITTYKEEKEVIEKKSSVHITSSEVASFEENVYTYMDVGLEKEVNRIMIRTTKKIRVGSIVTIGDNLKEKDSDYICKVIDLRKEKKQYIVGDEIKEDEFLILDVVTPNVDDVYLELDIYGERQATLEGIIDIDKQTIIDNVLDNEGIVLLKDSIKNALNNSPTVLSYASKLSTEAEKKDFMVALASFDFKKPKVKINVKGTELSFEIELSGEIQIKNFKVSVAVVISNETSVDYRYTICKSKLVTLNPLLWFYTDVKVDLANDFSITLQAAVEFTDANEDIKGIIDITDEVEYIIDMNKDGQNKFAEAITGSPLWDDDELEYVDIFSIPLGQIPLPVPIVSLQLDFNVVGSLGARAGLYIEFSHHYVESTTLTNGACEKGENGKPVMYDSFRFTRETTKNEINIDITLKGQVGFRCGLEAKLSLSVARLNNVAAAYVSFRFGPYIELTGLVDFNYSYDAVNKVSETHLYGGMYLEVGIFVNAKIGAKFLVYDVNTDIFDKKISLYGVGDRLIPLGFTEKINSPENPVVVTSRYGGVRMNSVQMTYLDIVTGEKVIDNALINKYGAQLSYTLEFYDAPDYQTKDYEKYIILKGTSTIISNNYPYKSLKFAVKAKLEPKHGVYASNIERIFYVEYRNPAGRDYAIQNSEFRNEYYAGGGATYRSVLAFLSFKEGEQVVPPEYNLNNLPVRQGYYLELDDLWEKYYPFLNNKVDEEFDGTFPVVTYENANMIFNGYLKTNTCYYRLKWKRQTYSASFYYPTYANSSTIISNNHLLSANMVYVPSLRAFIVLTDKISAPDIYGKKFDSFTSSSGLSFKYDYYKVDPTNADFEGLNIAEGFYPIIRVDTSSNLYLDNFKMIANGIEFYATYTDSNVITETYVLEGEATKRIKVEYKPFDYANKVIRPSIPEGLKIGTEFEENGKTYVIKGYRDINPEDEANSRYYDEDLLPNVTKNRIYYVLYEREGLASLPVYYVNIMANNKLIGDYGVKEGEEINLALIKINFYDKYIVSQLTNYATSMIDDVISSYSVKWNDTNVPQYMPSYDIFVNVDVAYSYKELQAEFIIKDPLQSFKKGTIYQTRDDGSRVVTILGKTWTSASNDEDSFYSLPKLNDYFDNKDKKYYAFYGWKDQNDDKIPYGVRIAFTKNETYTPIFLEKDVVPTISFINYNDYGYEYYYKTIEGDFFGKTLQEIINSEKINNPTRSDINGLYDYKFIGWGVDAKSYIIGSEKDLNGNIKTDLIFKAIYEETDKLHTITFDALDGKFTNGESTYTVTGKYKTDVSYVKPENYTNEKGTFTFICWTTIPYSLDDKANLVISNEDVTYYAYYSLSPATISLTFKGKVKTEASDGTGNVYFDNDKSKTELVVTGLYGSSYYLTANNFKVDSISKTFLPAYLKWTVDGNEYISEFYNDNYMANIPFDNNAIVEICFEEPIERIVNIAFVSDGDCYNMDGSKIDNVTCKGYMSGFRHVINYYEPYGSKINVPYVDYYNENHYRFDHFEGKLNGKALIVKPGEEVEFIDDIVYYGVYVLDTNVKVNLTFRADTYSASNDNFEDDLVGLMVFKDGSVEIKNSGMYGETISFNEIPSCDGMKFVGWTSDGVNTVTHSELQKMTYDNNKKYYAVYEANANKYKIKLEAKNGKFIDGSVTKEINDIPYGRLTRNLLKPTPNDNGLIFSHYEDALGNPVTFISKEETLYACYGKAIKTFEELKQINLSLKENYVLTNNIVVGGHIYGDDEELASWTSIGEGSSIGYSGKFNGNGYKINISAKSGNKENFGLFSKISGTLYNLSFVGYYSISNTTDALSLGALAKEVTKTGKIIDCQSFVRLDVNVEALNKIAVSGAIGINNGYVDGLMASMGGTINIDSSEAFTVGGAVAINNGTMKNVNQSGMGGSLYVSLARSLSCNIGSFVGYNTGSIENSFSERGVVINLSQGDNTYLKDSALLGGFAGKNDGSIKNATSLYGKLEYSVSNLTLFKKSGLHIDYDPYSETPCYIISEIGKDNQGIVYKPIYVIYLDNDATKKGSSEYEEYTKEVFATKHPSEAKKIDSLRDSVLYDGFVPLSSGETINCTIVEDVGTGNGVELVSSCNFDGLKWNYLERLHQKVYGA